MIRVAFRFDDPSPVSKRHVEEQVFEQFFSRRIPITCGVIPARIRGGTEIRLSGENAGLLREAAATGLLDVALHGLFHRNAGRAPSDRKSEFEGLPLSEQGHLVNAGRSLLQEVLQISVSGFIPPWNTYDANTLKVLEERGFGYISADKDRPPYFPKKLRVLPATCVLGQLEETIEKARQHERHRPVIIVVMHHYDFDPDPDDPPYQVFSYKRLGEVLDELSISPEVTVESLDGLSASLTARESKLWEKQEMLKNVLPKRYMYRLDFGFMVTKLF